MSQVDPQVAQLTVDRVDLPLAEFLDGPLQLFVRRFGIAIPAVLTLVRILRDRAPLDAGDPVGLPDQLLGLLHSIN